MVFDFNLKNKEIEPIVNVLYDELIYTLYNNSCLHTIPQISKNITYISSVALKLDFLLLLIKSDDQTKYANLDYHQKTSYDLIKGNLTSVQILLKSINIDNIFDIIKTLEILCYLDLVTLPSQH